MKDINSDSASIISLEAARDKPNYYEILQISPEASHAEIVLAYRRARKAYRQNSLTAYSLFSDEEMTCALNIIDDAYHVLGFPEKRRLYDQAHFPAGERQTVSGNGRPSIKKKASRTRRKAARADKAFETLVSQTSEFNGSALRAIREHRKLALKDIAEQTKINKSFLAMIEEEQSDMLPPKAYFISFLRQYAASLGLDPQKVVDSYPLLQDSK